MELNEEEKRQLFQVDGDCQAKVLDELYMTARFTRNPEQRDIADLQSRMDGLWKIAKKLLTEFTNIP